MKSNIGSKRKNGNFDLVKQKRNESPKMTILPLKTKNLIGHATLGLMMAKIEIAKLAAKERVETS